ncbi:MAG TPA: c-type cytochrome [Herpetosiphonaceae bacterium]|nr:c-type cytochrome [Herpetosiphonaceae bacterium]
MTKNIAISLLFTVATVALLGYIWFGQTSDRLVATTQRQDAQQLEFGQRNYEQYCAACHGLAGEGAGPQLKSAPPLNSLQTGKGPGTEAFTTTNGIQKKYGSLRNYVEAMITNGIRGTAMPAWKQQGMRDDQIRAIAAYVMAMQGGAVSPVAKSVAAEWNATETAKIPTPVATPEPPLDDPQANAGRDLFRGRGCVGCHNVTDKPAVGPGLAGLFTPEGTVAYGTVLPNGEEVNDATVLEWIKVGGGGPGVGPDANDSPTGGGEYGPMPAQAGVVNDEEIGQIIAYLKTLTR